MQRLRYSQYFKSVIILGDIVIFALVFVYFFVRKNGWDIHKEDFETNTISLAILSAFWLLLGSRTKLYDVARNLTYTKYLERLVTHVLIFIVGVIFFAKVSNNAYLKYDRFLIAAVLFMVLFLVKSMVFFALKYLRTLGKNHRNVMFLFESSSVSILKNIFLERKDYGYKIFDYHGTSEVAALKSFWQKNGIHTMYLPSEIFLQPQQERDIFLAAEACKVRIALVPNVIQPEFFAFQLDYVESLPILSPTKFPQDFLANYLIKRFFDIIFSLAVLIFICSWLFPLLSLLIIIDSKGPVFFRQKRYGYHDEVFNCFKFRTMAINRHSTTKTTSENDPRITRIGKFLRRTSLDELPQFWNVLQGSMSVVGPRPHMLLVDDFYKTRIGRYSIRSLVKPGVTGLAQVNGLRGDAGNMDIEMQKRILADSYYVKNWTLVLDIIIIAKTLVLVLRGDKNAF